MEKPAWPWKHYRIRLLHLPFNHVIMYNPFKWCHVFTGIYLPVRQHKVLCVHTQLLMQKHAGSLKVYDYKVKRVNEFLHPLVTAIVEQSAAACLQAKTADL